MTNRDREEAFRYMLWSHTRGGTTERMIREMLAAYAASGKSALEITFRYEHSNPEELENAREEGRQEILARMPTEKEIAAWADGSYVSRLNAQVTVDWLRNRLEGKT